MPTVLEFFQWRLYAFVGSITLALCICIISVALIEIRKKWRG
jgi:hypothetical protein